MARTKKKYFFTRTFCYIFLKKNICFKHIACGYSLVFSYFKMARLTKFNTFPNFSKMYYIFGKHFFFKHIACGYSLVLSHQGLSDIKVDLSIPKCVCRFVRKNCKLKKSQIICAKRKSFLIKQNMWNHGNFCTKINFWLMKCSSILRILLSSPFDFSPNSFGAQKPSDEIIQ